MPDRRANHAKLLVHVGQVIVGLRFANPTYQIYAQNEQILPRSS